MTDNAEMYDCYACGEEVIGYNTVTVTDADGDEKILCGSCFMGGTEVPE